MEFKDYYRIMGVERGATQDEIKRAYRKLARRYHPDVSKERDAEERFKEVNEAYEVLGDPEKRAAYDRLGTRWQAGQEFHPPPDWEGFGFRQHGFDGGFEGGFGGGFEAGPDSPFSDFFEALFGRGGFSRGAASPFGGSARGARSTFRASGADRHATLAIDLEDALHGATRTITLNMPEVDASGRRVMRERTFNVRIPKGVSEGQRIRLAGQGEAGSGGGPAGDLYLEVAFKPHRLFRVEGRDLHLELPVAPWEAALGASVKAPTPGGTVEVKVPAGSQSGRKLRLKGRGIPGDPPGDLYLTLQVVLPPAAGERAKAAYRAFEKELYFNPRQALGV